MGPSDAGVVSFSSTNPGSSTDLEGGGDVCNDILTNA